MDNIKDLLPFISFVSVAISVYVSLRMKIEILTLDKDLRKEISNTEENLYRDINEMKMSNIALRTEVREVKAISDLIYNTLIGNKFNGKDNA